MSSWMKRYYNGAALAGGWSIGTSPALTSTHAITPDTLLEYGNSLIQAMPTDVQTKLATLIANLVTKGEIPDVDEARAAVGLIAMLDSIKIYLEMPNTGATEDQRRLLQARWRILREQYADVIAQKGYKKIRKFFHPPQKLTKEQRAALRQPAFAEGPFVPYSTMKYFSGIPQSWGPFKRGGKTYKKIDIPTGIQFWNRLPEEITALPPSETGWKWSDEKKAFYREWMQKMNAAWKAHQRGDDMVDVAV